MNISHFFRRNGSVNICVLAYLVLSVWQHFCMNVIMFNDLDSNCLEITKHIFNPHVLFG